MTNLKETAMAYEPKKTLNIADLDRVDISFPMADRKSKDKEGKEFDYKVMMANEQEYRTPASVLEEIQKILKLRPDAKFVNVTKKGSGLNTSYDVELIEDTAEPKVTETVQA